MTIVIATPNVWYDSAFVSGAIAVWLLFSRCSKNVAHNLIGQPHPLSAKLVKHGGDCVKMR
jgi:hypothetical protein